MLSSIISFLTGCISTPGPDYRDHLNRSFVKSLESSSIKEIQQHLNRGADLNRIQLPGKTIHPLIYAIKKQNTDGAWFLLKLGAEINVTDSRGWSPLMWAVYNYEWELAQVLVEMGSDVNHKAKDGITPVDIAARSMASVSFFNFLLEHGALLTRDTLHWALEKESEYDVIALLAKRSRESGYEIEMEPLLQKVLFNETTGLKESYDIAGDELRDKAVAFAAATGGIEALAIFKTQGADLSREYNGDTLLKTSVYYKQEGCVRYLLDNGVTVSGYGPFYYAVYHNQVQLAGLMINQEVRDNSHDMLIHAVRKSGVEMLELLLASGLEFNEDKKIIPNDILRRKDCIPLIEYLLTKGFNLNRSDDYDSLIKYAGFSFVDYDSFLWLLDNGCEITLFESYVDNPVYVAAQYGLDASKVAELLDRGGILDTNSFIMGIRSADLEIVRVMVEHGADLNTEFRGVGLLTFASGLGYEHIAEYLIEKGMDVNQIEKNGLTPLWAAVQEDNLEAAEVLLKAGANLTVKDSSGLTLFDYVQKKKRYLMADLIQRYSS